MASSCNCVFPCMYMHSVAVNSIPVLQICIIFLVVLCGCETWSLTVREEHILRVVTHRLVRRTYGTERDSRTRGWWRLHNEELYNLYASHMYEGSIQPFWIPQELVTLPWCNLAASQSRHYCASVNSHSPVGLVSLQWDAVDWACMLCYCCIQKSPPFQWWF
jgi:hypothetical protein